MRRENLSVAERALKLKYDTTAALNAPMARILPGAVIAIIEDQAAIIAALAEQVRRLEHMMDLGDCDEQAG